MKKILTGILILCSVLVFGQSPEDDSRIRHGINFGSYFYPKSHGPHFFVGPSIESGHIFLSVAPVFGPKLRVLPNRIMKEEPIDLGLNGTYLSFQLRPNVSDRTIEFSFNYDFIFNYNKDHGRDEWQQNEKYQSFRSSFANFIGYGFNLKLIDHFYINHNMGVGIATHFLNVDYEAQRDIERLTFEPKFLIRMSLGYRI